MTYKQAIQYLYSLQMFGAKFGLEPTLKLTGLVGNPHEKLRFIHVAGTNGKGSVCAMLEDIYRRAGLRVGLYTSPHLVSFAERIQVDRQMISEADVARLTGELAALMSQFTDETHPTFFEFVTVMALKYFAEQKCDLVVFETGLGGRLDATNIVTPIASVITNIQMDHQQWLGDTLEKIAFEKAGIIKPGIPIITAAETPALEVIANTARERRAPLFVVSRKTVEEIRGMKVGLLGEHQRLNAAVAFETVRVLVNAIPVSQKDVADGLEKVDWFGRLQVIKRGKQTFLLDGAHNPAGVRTLAAALPVVFSVKPTLVMGAMKDKDWTVMCRTLAPLVSRICLCPTGNCQRTADPNLLKAEFRRANAKVPIEVFDSLALAMKAADKDMNVVLAGSLYIVGGALERLHFAKTGREANLNDWAPKSQMTTLPGENVHFPTGKD